MPVADVLAAITDHLARVETYRKFHDYLDGEHYYPFTGDEARRAREWQLEISVLNVCGAVRSAITDQIDLTGWDGADADAAHEHAFARTVGMAVDEAVGASDGYLHVWPNEAGEMRVLFHRADQAGFLPSDVDPDLPYLFYKPRVTPDGRGRVNLYYRAGFVERWVTREPITGTDVGGAAHWPTEDPAGWREYEDDGQPFAATFESVGLPALPWVHIPFRPSGHGGHGRSILADVIPLQDKLNRAETLISGGMEQYIETIKYVLKDAEDAAGEIVAATGDTTPATVNYSPRGKRLYEFIARGAGQFDPPNADNLLKIKAETLANIALVAGISPMDVMVSDIGNVPAASALRLLASRRTSTVMDFLTDVLTPALTSLAALFGLDASPVFRDPTPHDESEDLSHAQARADLGYTLEDNLVEMGVARDDAARIAANAANVAAAEGAAAFAAYREGRTPAPVA